MSVELKIKASTLTAESRFIRKQELRLRKAARAQRGKQETASASKLMGKFKLLQDHRLGVVRRSARSTHLARAFIKGQPLFEVEQIVRLGKAIPYEAIISMAMTYGYEHSEGLSTVARRQVYDKRLKAWMRLGRNAQEDYAKEMSALGKAKPEPKIKYAAL